MKLFAINILSMRSTDLLALDCHSVIYFADSCWKCIYWKYAIGNVL